MPVRVKAFLIHLCSSLVIISLFFTVLYTAWYPDFFFELEGVWGVAKMVMLVDIVVGPFLTLIIYDLRKGIRVVRRDIAVIVLVQIVALGWGVRASYLGQPDYLAFSSGMFYTISRNELVGENPAPQFAVSSWDRPLSVYVRPIADEKERSEQIVGFVFGGLPDTQYQFDRYQSYQANREAIMAAGITVEKAVAGDEQRRLQVDDFLAQHGGEEGDYLLYTVFAHTREGTLMVSRDGVQPVGFIDMIIN